jgi:hypothetical protein
MYANGGRKFQQGRGGVKVIVRDCGEGDGNGRGQHGAGLFLVEMKNLLVETKA